MVIIFFYQASLNKFHLLSFAMSTYRPISPYFFMFGITLTLVLSLVGAIIISIVTSSTVIDNRMANIRNDIRCDTITIREGLRSPLTQKALEGAISYDPGSNSLVYSDGSQTFNAGWNNPASTVIFRPGFTGTTPGVYAD